MILSKQHEAKLQQETTDNLGYAKTEFDSATIPSLEEFQGAISESLLRHLEIEPLTLVGLSEVTGRVESVRISLNGKFINAERLVGGYSLGRKMGVAVKYSNSGFWGYTKAFANALETHGVSQDHWKFKLHIYYR